MSKVTPREIAQSLKAHAEDAGQGARRHLNRGPQNHTSESDRAPRPMFNRRKADPRDRFWRALGKQVAQGAGVRLTVRG